MHPSIHAAKNPDKPAYIMATTGEVVTFGELNDISIQMSRVFRDCGLQVGDAIAFYLENHKYFHIIACAAHRAGLYFTPISNKLTAEEVDYIVADCGAKLFICSTEYKELAAEMNSLMPGVKDKYMLSGTIDGYKSLEDATAAQSTEPLADETSGSEMLYSSGTTGRPKGVRRPLPGTPITTPTRMAETLPDRYGIDENTVYLSPAPLYHAAPLGFSRGVLAMGGTVVIMDKFGTDEALRLIEKYKVTHSQWVPTMFVRFLKEPVELRTKYDLSSHQVAIHAAAPCPVKIKEQMIEWWGTIIHEYYAGSEGNGTTIIDSEDWLLHKGSVGRTAGGAIHICGEDGKELPAGESGTIYFESGVVFTYHNDEGKTAGSYHPEHPEWSTLGDVGRVDEDGYLYLTDRKAFMIISGGVNIYPQEVENHLITHPKIADVAVIGVPNEDFGEEVKAVVQPIDMADATEEFAEELIQFCKDHISSVKCPRSVDFDPELPRHPNGKMYKRLVRDRYWGKMDSKIV
ncbi:MAG: acyl-CoA synthetase [Pseudomonadales bacterium]|nr:acyl-CoA synthetase [Pseudomonadales bacterium]